MVFGSGGHHHGAKPTPTAVHVTGWSDAEIGYGMRVGRCEKSWYLTRLQGEGSVGEPVKRANGFGSVFVQAVLLDGMRLCFEKSESTVYV